MAPAKERLRRLLSFDTAPARARWRLWSRPHVQYPRPGRHGPVVLPGRCACNSFLLNSLLRFRPTVSVLPGFGPVVGARLYPEKPIMVAWKPCRIRANRIAYVGNGQRHRLGCAAFASLLLFGLEKPGQSKDERRKPEMIQYYLFMALLCTTLGLWAYLAIRDDSPADAAEEPGENPGEVPAEENSEHA